MDTIDNLAIEYLDPRALKPRDRNARTHSGKQLKQIANSIKEFGFTNPVLIDNDNMIVAGHGRVAAAKTLGMKTVPTVRLASLSPEQLRAYALADNRLAELAGWDDNLLALELCDLSKLDLGFDLTVTGFETADIDLLLGTAKAAAAPEPAVPQVQSVAVTRPGDLWRLGNHRLYCSNALDADSWAQVMGGELADMAISDPPYNVPVDGHVSGLGRNKHREFAFASGEMDKAEFTTFLTSAFENMAAHSRSGSLHYHFMDWRHMAEMLAAGSAAYDGVVNLCVWAKTNGGMGSFYRSQHELVFVFRHGDASHVNNVELGRFGRNRTNLWTYAGANTFRAGRDAELAAHPTPKPVALVADAILDATPRNGIVVDAFGGSGTTLIAAERTGRQARLMEIDPLYCDVTIRRWQAETGQAATLESSGVTFDEMLCLT